jgi:hypothetical protein
VLVKSYSEDEDVQKLNYEGLSEAKYSNYQRPNIQDQPDFKISRFIRSKVNSNGHQKGYFTKSYKA